MARVTPEVSSFARYVPRLSAEWDLRTSELWREIDGTLCYVDISGFTALSESLARRGRIGAEELTEVLNFVFGKMLAIAYDRGGSLLKFGGDALLLVFRGVDHPIQACSAAVEMQAALRQARTYETSAGRLNLKMSVGLHSGSIHLFRVGSSHKELILTGPAASMTTEMEETAESGEILISSSTREAIPGGANLKPKGDGWLLNWRKDRIECCGWSPRISLDPEAIAEGIPVALRQHLQYGAAEPEHHIATVGFIRYTGVDALMQSGGPGRVASALAELVESVQEAVDAEGVTFLASDIDQDGGKIVLVAGVPGVQEDDEGRVLRAARRIADSAGTLRLRIGINQGHVFVGEIGTEFRATYTVMGDTVNLAARLMAAASPGEVFASPSALELAHTLYDTSPLEPFLVKGKEHPVQAYAVGVETGNRTSEQGDSLPFAGRADELARLRAMAEALIAGTGGVVAIVGERGIGKSRLVDELLPSLSGAHHLDIRAEPYGIGTPYRPLRDPVRRLLGVERGSHKQMGKQLEAGLTALGSDLLPLLPLVADVVMIDVPSTPEVDRIEPRFRQDRTADLIVEILTRSFDGPVFIEIEDGHNMDEASTFLMMRVAAEASSRDWLVLTTLRDSPDGFHPDGDAVDLEPLNADDSRQLVLAATEAAPLRTHDVDSIVRRAGGLPLFLEEIIRAVRQAGGVEELPDSLDAVVSSQIDGLEPLARRLLRFASVLGRSFRVTALNELISEEGIELDAATRRELDGFLDPDGSGRLRFRHAVLRDVAYQGLSFKRRRELHLRAGLTAERAAGDHAETVADVLALHFSIAQDHERAWRYSVLAGDQARATYANVDAAAFYERGLEAARKLRVGDVEKAQVWTSLGDVRQHTGLFEGSLDAYRRAARLVSDDTAWQVDLVLRRANVRRLSGNYSAALRETTLGLGMVEGKATKPAIRARARIGAERAAIRRWQQRPQEALSEATEAEKAARAVGELVSLGHALELMDWAYWMLGETELAVHSSEALGILEDLGDLSGMAQLLNNVGAYAYWQGRWDDAIEAYDKAADRHNQAGNGFQAAICEANMAELLINQNRLDQAGPLLTDAVRVLKASNHAPAVTFAETELARLLIREGNFEDAELLLGAIRERSAAAGESMSELAAAVQLADSKLRQGKATGALELLDEAGSEAGEMLGPAVADLRGRALAELSRYDQALEEVETGLERARKQGLLYDQAVLLAAKSQIISQSGGEPNPDDELEADRLFGEMDIRREPVMA